MVNGALHFRFCARDFRFERGDARAKLFHGKGVEILPGEQDQRIIRLAGRIFVKVHGRNVDPFARTVNNKDV